MSKVLSGKYEGGIIRMSGKYKCLYISYCGSIIPLDSAHVSSYGLKEITHNPLVQFDRIFVIKWNEGGSSVIGIMKPEVQLLVMGCETEMLDDNDTDIIKHKRKLLKILLVAILLGLGLGVLFTFTGTLDGERRSTSNATATTVKRWASWDGTAENIPSAKVPVYVGEATGDSTYGYGNIRGVAYNRSADNFSYIQITFGLYNSNGAKIDTCLTNMAGLKSGEKWQFNAYCSSWGANMTYSIDDVVYW